MTYYDIFDSAIAAVCEDVTASHATEDYRTRAQYLMGSFVVQYANLDSLWRTAHGMNPVEIDTDTVSVEPDDDFPLSDIFIPVAINCLAAGLVLDENEEMSDKFFDRYITGVMDIRKALPCRQSSIVDKYGLD